MHDTFDVGIVGAGVAGSSCAQVLGEAGVKVALFDHSHPREKPCGGLIDGRVVEEFNVPEKLLENKVRCILAERFKFRVKLFFEPPLFLVLRKDFDYYMLQKALKNKSVVFFDEKVNQAIRGEKGWILKTNENRCVKVKALIGADGCPSFIRKCTFRSIPPQFLATTAGYNFPCSSKYIEKAFSKNTVEAYYSRKYVQKGGFIWIFPKRASINVGIGNIGTRKKLKKSLSEFIFSHPAGERLRHLKGRFFSHLIPIIRMEGFFDLPCSGEDWALIGDAAGHVNPINGMGIYYAMKGGMLCGLAFLDGDLNRFEKCWRKEYGKELYHGAKNFSKFYGNLGFFSWLWYIFENFLGR